MLIEIWERLRGYDKWTLVEATVESSELRSYPTEGATVESSDDVIVWTDGRGEKHRASFTARSDSPLYQLIKNSTVSLRYNPADPEKYYLRQLTQTRARRGALVLKVVFAIIAALLLLDRLRTLFGSR